MPNAINNILYNIVDAYNKKEVQIKKSQKISTHLLTVLTKRVITQLEQRKRNERDRKGIQGNFFRRQ